MTRELRHQILRAATRDQMFLKLAWRDIEPAMFSGREEEIVATAAVRFYQAYEEPVGPMLENEVSEVAQEYKLGEEGRQKLQELVKKIQGHKMELVSVRALLDKVKAVKKYAFYDKAVQQIVDAQGEGKLNTEFLAQLVDKANKELYTQPLLAHNVLDELDKRIKRRATAEEDYPLLHIPGLDNKTRLLGRGQLGMLLAPPSGGKGLGLLHIAIAYAQQGLNVFFLTLEDPLSMVEDRFDACLTGIPLTRLKDLPNKLHNRYKRIRSNIRGRIHIVDGGEQAWTVTAIERALEEEKRNGFVADAVVVDYDDEIECEKQFKGESARRFEFSEIFKRLRRLARTTRTFTWTAAQTGKPAEAKKVIGGKDVAEDYSKIRKTFVAIGVGQIPEEEDVRYLWVIKNRSGRRHFGVEIVSDYASAVFFDPSATAKRDAILRAQSYGNH